MDGGPPEPRTESAYLNFPALQHSKTLAHHCHAAFVKVAKWARCGFARDAVANHLACVATPLNGYLRDARKRFAVLIERRSIADHEDLWMSGDCEIVLSAHP